MVIVFLATDVIMPPDTASGQEFISVMHLLFAIRIVMKFIIASTRGCTCDEDST